MRLALVVAVLTLLAASCSSDGETGTANTSAPVANSTVEATAPSAALGDLIAEVDLLVTMFPGSGPGPQAERLAAEMANDALPGSADHLASVATADGLVNIVAYQDRMPNAGGGDRMFCVAGLPDTITFYDADGSPGFHMSYDLR